MGNVDEARVEELLEQRNALRKDRNWNANETEMEHKWNKKIAHSFYGTKTGTHMEHAIIKNIPRFFDI